MPFGATVHNRWFRCASVAARLTRLAATAGLTAQVNPHGLHRTFCTAGLVAGLPLRDRQCAMRMRDADARTTTGYDMARSSLDRQSTAVVAYLAGMASD